MIYWIPHEEAIIPNKKPLRLTHKMKRRIKRLARLNGMLKTSKQLEYILNA